MNVVRVLTVPLLLVFTACGGSEVDSSRPQPGAGRSTVDSGQNSESAPALESTAPRGAVGGAPRDPEESLGGLGGLGGGPTVGASTAGQGGAGQGSQTSGACVGTLQAVNQMGDAPCPSTLCAAQVWASNCESLPDTVTKSALGGCNKLPTLTLQFASGGGKTCRYGMIDEVSTEPHLASVEVWDSETRFCGGTSNSINSINAGNVPGGCSSASVTVCDRASMPEAGSTSASGAVVPPALCFNNFDKTCAPCCDDAPLDCAGKPSGYPGYSCTPRPPGNAFCSCSCGNGKWDCGC